MTEQEFELRQLQRKLDEAIELINEVYEELKRSEVANSSARCAVNATVSN